MHILIIPSERYVTTDKPLGAIFQYHQAHALKHAGLKIGVVAPAPCSLRYLKRRPRGCSRGIEFYIDDGIPVYRFQGSNWTTGKIPALYQAYWDRIGRRLYERYVSDYGRPDLIHAHNTLQAGVFAVRYLAPRGIPVVITEHSSIYVQRRLKPWQRENARYALKKASARLVVTPKLGERLEELFGDSVRPWRVVPNVLENMFEHAKLSPLDTRDKGFVFLNVAMLQPVKNHVGLLKAFSLAFKGRLDVRLRIGGDGPLMRQLQDLVVNLGIAKQVHFLGRLNREQVLSEMQACDAFVLPSFYETFGVVLIEAAACGKPLIATQGSGPDSIVNEENGLLVPPGDDKALAQAMITMYEHASDYDPTAIRRACLARYGEKAVVDQLKAIYQQVLA